VARNTQPQVYAEALEQVVNADRLGYSTFSIIEHFFFPKFGASPNPFAFFGKAFERTRNIKFRTLLHVPPFHNPTVLASQIAHFDTLADGRYEFGLGRGHAWIPLKAGVPRRWRKPATVSTLQASWRISPTCPTTR